MPYYEYHCPANGQTVEVRHGMNERLTRWSEVVERAHTEPGDTPLDSPVERLMSVPGRTTSGSAAADVGGCGQGCGCALPN